ncbi:MULTISPECIES: hypothetical protein [Protofrankia]|uniref:hypothetical protein n=1 Tax=Protofrankia TaxID=2994361 RepID=UPI000AA150CD|nr:MULTISPECIES: hypothetical protein [Protofrankia]
MKYPHSRRGGGPWLLTAVAVAFLVYAATAPTTAAAVVGRITAVIVHLAYGLAAFATAL